jgi:uncharacterized membrane-anchored protein YhcB (DUF1043 family)
VIGADVPGVPPWLAAILAIVGAALGVYSTGRQVQATREANHLRDRENRREDFDSVTDGLQDVLHARAEQYNELLADYRAEHAELLDLRERLAAAQDQNRDLSRRLADIEDDNQTLRRRLSNGREPGGPPPL